MLLGGLLNIFIALALTFASTALVVSTVVEAVASMLKWRANTLLAGLTSILNVDALSSAGVLGFLPMVKQFLPPKLKIQPATNLSALQTANLTLLNNLLNHAAINPRGPGNNAQASIKRASIASYIPSPQFALALLDVLKTGPDKLRQTLKTGINSLPDPQLKQYLTGVFDRASGDEAKMRAEIAAWFDSAMDRVSGDYKRYTQLWSIIFGFLIAAAFNIDTIKIIHTALANPILLANLQTNVPVNGLDGLGSLKDSGLAIGWPHPWGEIHRYAKAHVSLVPLKLIGWFMTATAALFGAPFWFDTLQRFVSLRGTGDPPATAAPAK